MPQRLQRTRRRSAATPTGAIYVGRPTLWANPFERRRAISHTRAAILYHHWLAGDLTPFILSRAHFSPAEIGALRRWRETLTVRLAKLRGRDLQCWCPLTAPCHADTLLRVVNAPVLDLAA